MPKTIADLGSHHRDGPKATVGKDMLSDGDKSVESRIEELKRRYEQEQAELEAGGYDYNGNEDWDRVMRNVGRR